MRGAAKGEEEEEDSDDEDPGVFGSEMNAEVMRGATGRRRFRCQNQRFQIHVHLISKAKDAVKKKKNNDAKTQIHTYATKQHNNKIHKKNTI